MPRLLHRDAALVQKIRDKYLKQVLKQAAKTVPGIAEDDVLWIGPLSDGLVAHGLFRRAVGTDRGRWPNKDISYKSFILGTIMEGDEQAKGMFNAGFAFQRGTGTLVYLNAPPRNPHEIPIRDAEPGELLNSPKLVSKSPGEAVWEYDPIIRIDERFGLHFLLRGDHFLKETEMMRGRRSLGVLREEYRLRPISEGSSLVPPQRASQPIAQY